MLKSIIVRDIADYDQAGINLGELKKINFIYGANGSGKTTISSYLMNSENDRYRITGCSLNWYHQPIDILVFNKEFKEKNFGQGKLPGVFTLGNATKELMDEIENKKKKLEKIAGEGDQNKTTLDKQILEKQSLEDESKEQFWSDTYKKYEDTFKEAFTGYLTKEKFKAKLLLESNKQSNLETFDVLQRKANTIFGNHPVTIELIPIVNLNDINQIINHVIWSKVIIGKSNVDISLMIESLEISDWVNQGRQHLSKITSITENRACPFCQQETISKEFEQKLEQFFDKTYMNDIDTLNTIGLQYRDRVSLLINSLQKISLNQKENLNSKIDCDQFNIHLKTLEVQCTGNLELISQKLKEPSKPIELHVLTNEIQSLANLINIANQEIKEHNEIVNNLQNEKTLLVQSIWRFISHEYSSRILKYNGKISGFDRGINALKEKLDNKRKEYRELRFEIENLSSTVTSVEPTIVEINRLLKSFGFKNFELVVAKENGFYQIQRQNGEIAENTLSEGEVSFITFLYYLHLAKGGLTENTVTNNRILVIDDPISSLDSGILFVVSSLIKEIIKEVKSDQGSIKQIILLTHNIYFHKEVSFIDGRTKSENNVNFWIIRKPNQISTLQSFGTNNPILSSYELLWNELKNENIQNIIVIQNVMRRIIENYFKILGKYSDDKLIQSFTTLEEKDICRSLLYWINDGSHGIYDDLEVGSQDKLVDSYKSVFKQIFIQTGHESHYDMMMENSNV